MLRPLLLYLLVMTVFLGGELQAGTVYLLEPPAKTDKQTIYSRFFNELALVLVQDELYQKSDELKSFYTLPPEQKVVEAGLLCGEDQTLSVVWIEADGDEVKRLGLVVSTANGKLARWIQFDSPVSSLSDLAIITGELLSHGRTFAASSTAEKDGWILVDSEAEKKVQAPSTVSPAALLDVEKPWDRPLRADADETRPRISLGAQYGVEAGLSGEGAPMWMGGRVIGSLWISEQWAISLMTDIYGGAIPDPKDSKVRGVRLAPAVSLALLLDFGMLGLKLDLAAGPMITILDIRRDGQPNTSDRWLSGQGRFEMLLVLAPGERISLNFGYNVVLSLPARRFVESVSGDTNVVYASSIVSIGGVVGTTLRF